MSQTPAPPSMPGPAPGQRPHRGGIILALGILGLLICVILGIVAWVMGNGDLREMDAGRMDPAGRGLTQAGKILGMIAVGLWVLGILFYILMFVIFGAAAIAGASGGSP